MKRSSVLWTVWGLIAVAAVGLALAAHLGPLHVCHHRGSMTGAIPRAPSLSTGTSPLTSLQVGDVITFRPPSDAGNVTHRIVEVQRMPRAIRYSRPRATPTRPSIPWLFTLDKSVQAKYAFHIPYVGYVLAAFTFRAVRTAILVIVAPGDRLAHSVVAAEDPAARRRRGRAAPRAGGPVPIRRHDIYRTSENF